MAGGLASLCIWLNIAATVSAYLPPDARPGALADRGDTGDAVRLILYREEAALFRPDWRSAEIWRSIPLHDPHRPPR